MAYRYGIGDTVTWTDKEGVKREGVIKEAGYKWDEELGRGSYIQDEYGRPGVLIQVPGEWGYKFALGSEIAVVGGERCYPEDEPKRNAPMTPPCPGYGERHHTGHMDCLACYPD
ncbi:hypothetical protein ACFRCI_17355 [Streptomyces sp. NPDC056638]|uniref:hypothetical protein n=1 Tax=Streptomyces sp. NPDC056638 TaxID=3345887 RepID=UPI00369900D2